MNVWLVAPAFGRYTVSKLAFQQWTHLCGVLAERGVTANIVVVADDDNLDLAREHGFHTVEQNNEYLGRKVNDGLQYAYERGADYAGFVGSDDWLHPDLFDPLLTEHERPPMVAGHHIAVVDLEHGLLRTLGVRGPNGVSPWLIPRWALTATGGRPADDARKNGMERSLIQGLPEMDWLFHDPHPLTRVDFKSGENMTAYRSVASTLGYGDEVSQPWEFLAERFPPHLVSLAERTHLRLSSLVV